MLGAGLSEAQTLSLLPPSLPDRLELPADHPWRNVLTLDNPLSEEESVLRPAMLPGLLLAAERNVARRVPTVALFEIGNVFAPVFETADGLPHEEQRVAWIMTGRTPDGWHGEREHDVFDAKGVLDALLSGLGALGAVSVEQSATPVLHPGRTGRVVAADGREIGFIGELHPRIARTLDLPARTAVGELALAPLFASAPLGEAPDLPRYPAVDRDVAVVVPAATASVEVRDVIAGAGGDLLESVELFDVYRGAQVGGDNVSLAFRLAFRHPERTLTDAEAAESMETLVAALRARGWSPRE